MGSIRCVDGVNLKALGKAGWWMDHAVAGPVGVVVEVGVGVVDVAGTAVAVAVAVVVAVAVATVGWRRGRCGAIDGWLIGAVALRAFVCSAVRRPAGRRRRRLCRRGGCRFRGERRRVHRPPMALAAARRVLAARRGGVVSFPSRHWIKVRASRGRIPSFPHTNDDINHDFVTTYSYVAKDVWRCRRVYVI